jgi:hypothetical protein
MPSLGLGLGLQKQQMLKKPSFILDDIDANMLYFSFSKIHKDDTVCIRVRRDSDNTEKNIGFKNNFLDIDDLLSFVGGGNGYVTATYAQGQTSSFQSNLSAQPLIVENGVYLGTLKFSGGQWLDTGVERFGNTGLFADENEEFTVITVTKNEGTGTIIGRATASVGHRTFQTYFSSEGTLFTTVARGARNDTLIYSSSENKIIICIWDKSNLSGYINGVFFPLEAGSATERTDQRIIVGARTNGEGYFYEGDITAFIILDKALTTQERQKLENYLNQQFIGGN